MKKYLSFDSYDGTLTGIQSSYFDDNNLPVDKVISPGGLSTLNHHWTGGMDNDITSDVFAGTGDRYVAGEYGNLYKKGHSAVHQVYKGPHTDITEQNTLSKKYYFFNVARTNVDNLENIELIETPTEETIPPVIPPSKILKNSEVIIEQPIETSLDMGPGVGTYFSAFTFILVLVVAGFWHDSIRKFIEQYLNSNQNTTWQKCSLYTLGMSLFLAGFIYVFKIERLISA